MGYGCRSGKSSQREVKLFTDGSFGVQVEYAVMGRKEGAEYVAVDYWVDISSSVPGEAKYRDQFIEFIADLAKASLQGDLPNKFLSDVKNLASYGPSGKPVESEFQVGSGRIILLRSKGPQGGSIMATAKIYPPGDSLKR